MDAEEYKRWLEEEAARVEAQRRPKEKPYDGRGMNVDKMPFGCWIMLALAVLAALAAFGGLAKIVH